MSEIDLRPELEGPCSQDTRGEQPSWAVGRVRGKNRVRIERVVHIEHSMHTRLAHIENLREAQVHLGEALLKECVWLDQVVDGHCARARREPPTRAEITTKRREDLCVRLRAA